MKQNYLGGQKLGWTRRSQIGVQRERQVWVCLNETLSRCSWQLRSGGNLADLSQVGRRGPGLHTLVLNPAIEYFPRWEGAQLWRTLGRGTAVEEAALFCWDHHCRIVWHLRELAPLGGQYVQTQIPHTQQRPLLGLNLYSYHFKILDSIWIRGPILFLHWAPQIM